MDKGSQGTKWRHREALAKRVWLVRYWVPCHRTEIENGKKWFYKLCNCFAFQFLTLVLTGFLFSTSRAHARTHCQTPGLDRRMSLTDRLYRQFIYTKFFTKGWGSSETLFRYRRDAKRHLQHTFRSSGQAFGVERRATSKSSTNRCVEMLSKHLRGTILITVASIACDHAPCACSVRNEYSDDFSRKMKKARVWFTRKKFF